MQKVTLTQGQLSDLALVIANLPPKSVPTLKALSQFSKLKKFILTNIKELVEKTEALDDTIRENRKKMNGMDEEAKKAYIEAQNIELQPALDEINALREQELELEFSQDQVKCVTENFDLIKPSYTKIDAVVDLAEAFGMDLE